ncbi:MAG: type II toxin-antitoxin system RelE/ParE family toxin [Candidatus Coatesbacteria bacterium]
MAEYVAKDSPVYAAAIVREARDAARSLSRFPMRGRVVPELSRKDVRELIVGSYRMIYRVGAGESLILAFIHGARDVGEITREQSWRRGRNLN